MIETSPVEVFYHPANELGECPRWHPTENRLYWTDIESCRLFSLAPGETEPLRYTFDLKVGCFAFRRTGGLLLGTSQGFQVLEPGGIKPRAIIDPEPGKPGARFNDGQVDNAGRFWAGTMTETDATSSLYRLDPDFKLQVMATGVTISNGIGWSPRNDRMYFTDTLTKTIFVYRFEPLTGTISDRKVFVHSNGNGLPDGLSVDRDGNIWSVQCGGGCIRVYDPTGMLIQEIQLPTRCITACTFGGPENEDLYITSSRSLLPDNERDRDPFAGAVFRLHTSTHGSPQPFFAG